MKSDAEIQESIDSLPFESGPPPVHDAAPKTEITGRYAFIWAKNIEPSLRQLTLVKDILGEVDISVVYGDSGTTKTFFAVDIACHISAGQPWRGHAVTKGTAVYIAAENPTSVQNRVFAWCKHHGICDIDLVVMGSPVDLCDPKADTKPLIEDILKAVEGHPPVVLVVVDTLARAFGDGNENEPKDMGSFTNNMGLIRAETQAHVMIVHHTGKDKTRGARGHSSLRAAVDTEIEMEKNGSDVTVATVKKQRDGKEGLKFAQEIEDIEIGTDADGEPVRIGVAVETDAPAKKSKNPPKEGGPQGKALAALQDAIEQKGTITPASNHIPQNVQCTDWATWETFAKRSFKGMYDSNRRSYMMKDAMRKLIGKYAESRDDCVWLYP